MPLRKSPTITSRLLDANRANAQHCTGPKSAKGKACSRLNGGGSGQATVFDGEERKKQQKIARAKPECPLKSRGLKKRTHQVTENKQFNSTLRGKHVSIMSLGQNFGDFVQV